VLRRTALPARAAACGAATTTNAHERSAERRGARAQVAHLAQRTGGGAGVEGGGLAARSALGGLVPEALLHMLASYGAGAFAAALVGDSDTPELIWTHRMRAQRLVPEARAAPAPAARTRMRAGIGEPPH
jgi:hypothetical protein